MTEDAIPLSHSTTSRSWRKLTGVRKKGDLLWVRPDDKTQVSSTLCVSLAVLCATCGGWDAHGCGAFSSREPPWWTGLLLSSAGCGQSFVYSGLSTRCLGQLSFAIGVAKTLPLFMERVAGLNGRKTIIVMHGG